MLILASTSDKVQLVTDAVCSVDVHTSYVDLAAGVPTPGRKNTPTITTATTTDIVLAPAADTIRNVKVMHIRNKHATNSVGVSIVHTDGTNAVEINEAVLAAGEQLSWVESDGFRSLDTFGRLKTSAPAVSPLYVKALLANHVNSTVTMAEVTGITLALPPGRYLFQYYVPFQSAATATGAKFDVNFDGTVTRFVWNQTWVGNLNATSSDTMDQDLIAALGGVVSAFASRAKGTAGRGTLLGVDTANADMLVLIEGSMIVTVAGNLELWHASEVAASASTIMDGACVIAIKCD